MLLGMATVCFGTAAFQFIIPLVLRPFPRLRRLTVFLQTSSAIADQMEGDPTKHADYRRRIVEFIKDNREDFEPFVEDDVPFETYLAKMGSQGEWGGNMEIQAASMMLSVNITIHQLEQPRWEIANFDLTSARNLHLSYHDGDHYASVRRRDEPLHRVGVPAPIDLSKISNRSVGLSDASNGGKKKSQKSATWQEETVMAATDCHNIKFVKAVLAQSNDDVDTAVDFIISCGGAGGSIASQRSNLPDYRDHLTLFIYSDADFQREFLLDAGIYPSDDEVSDFGFGGATAASGSEDRPWEDYSSNKKTQASSNSSSSSASASSPAPPTYGGSNDQHNEGSDSDDGENDDGRLPRGRRYEKMAAMAGGKHHGPGAIPLRNHMTHQQQQQKKKGTPSADSEKPVHPKLAKFQTYAFDPALLSKTAGVC
jgi:OTU domain-containing protein 3